MKKVPVFQLCCIAALVSQPLTLKVVLIIIGSGIIVFVPLYKKHFKKK